MKIIPHPVNIYTPGRASVIRLGVIHSIELDYKIPYNKTNYSCDTILSRLKEGSFGSYHYLISRDGLIYSMVDVGNVAQHCRGGAIAIPDMIDDVDGCSIGIVLIGNSKEPYTSKQYESLAWLSNEVETQVMAGALGYIEHWVGHDWVSGLMHQKVMHTTRCSDDPGQSFDWAVFKTEHYRNLLVNELTPEWRNRLSVEIKRSLTIKECMRLILCRLSGK